ncbi:hypothetical protein I2I05_10115 [Hymenobacter sp. BT683]|uniref:histidine kinase n=1 Tax=Hymenobacter jeongseonensis TaxID=2791027 RepID=A0ABS0IHC0_9BACT|nr:ATP-binding protein [Hymenobacter jeongseonensis]MBF9237748.1 hypothetical protein [Hymenobacter jeongseonensis]
MVPPPEIAFTQLLFGGIAIMLLAAGSVLVFLVTYQKRLLQQQLHLRAAEALHQQELLQAIIEAQEGERERIGQDLHDGIGATIATVKLLVNRLSSLADQPPPPDLLALIEELTASAVHDVRSISHSLYPAMLGRYGLAEAVQRLVNVYNEAGTLPIQLELEYARPLGLPQELALYRICQELIHNALKHATGATRLQVRLKQHGVGVTLVVEDDGCGFPDEKSAPLITGSGLRSIDVRVQMLKARLERQSAPGQGTRMVIELENPV